MKKFYGGVFISNEVLERAGIKHPIKLEYYKKINEEEILKKDKAIYGISIVKTEYIEEKIKVEEKDINNLTNDENRAEYILDMLKENYVTPIGVEDVLNDFLRKGLQII